MGVNEDLAQIEANEESELSKIAAIQVAFDAFKAANPGVDVSAIEAALGKQAEVSAAEDALAADIPAVEPPAEPAA